MAILSQKARADKLEARMRAAKHTFSSLAPLIQKPNGEALSDAGLAKGIRNGTLSVFAAARIAEVLHLSSDEAAELLLGVKPKPPKIDAVETAAKEFASAIMLAARSAS